MWRCTFSCFDGPGTVSATQGPGTDGSMIPCSSQVYRPDTTRRASAASAASAFFQSWPKSSSHRSLDCTQNAPASSKLVRPRAPGSSEIMRLFIAREAVDAHLAAAGEMIQPGLPAAQRARAAAQAGRFYARWLPTLVTGEGQLPRSYAEFGPLAPHLRYTERASRKLARATFYGMARWQGRLERKQGFLGRLVDIGAELFAMSAVCVRAQMDTADDSGARSRTSFELASAFCVQARLRCEELFSQLWKNADAADAALARRVMSGRYTWLEQGIIDPSIPGPWVAEAVPGPSKHENVHRHIG